MTNNGGEASMLGHAQTQRWGPSGRAVAELEDL
jgi:hypothetical protein